MFSSKNRFHRRKHIEKVMRRGVSVRGRGIGLRYAMDDKPGFQVAVVVSKKVSKVAVTRNRIRRRVYAAIRVNEKKIPSGFRGVFSGFSEDLKNKRYADLEKEVSALLDNVKH